MTKESLTSNLKKTLETLPELIYAYIAGSFDTPFRTEHSDIDLILVWRQSPSLTVRNEILNRLKRLTSSNEEWTFLDSEGRVMRDAVKTQNFPKIEIYHHDFIGMENILQHQQMHEGLSFSISHRIPLIDSPEIEHFIDSYKPANYEHQQSLYFEIMADYQSKSASEQTYENIIKLFAINTYDGIPSRKHWDKIVKTIPNSDLLREGSTLDWITHSMTFLNSLANVAPNTQLSGANTLTLKKQHPATDALVFAKVLSQKERLQEYLSWPRLIQTIADQHRFSDKANTQWQSGQAFHFQIFHQAAFAGAISIHSTNYHERSFEFGYWIDQASEGQGHITQGLRLLILEMSEKGWHKAKIRFAKNNTKSKRVVERLRMKLEAETSDFATYSASLQTIKEAFEKVD